MTKGKMKWAVIFHANGITTLHYGLSYKSGWKDTRTLDITYTANVDDETMRNVLQEKLNHYHINIDTLEHQISEDGSMLVYYGEGDSFGK